MTEPSKEALAKGRQVASAWRADGRLGQLDRHIALAVQDLLDERDEKQQYIVDVCEQRRALQARLQGLLRALRGLAEQADDEAWPESRMLNRLDTLIAEFDEGFESDET
jgi:hypothetical protein